MSKSNGGNPGYKDNCNKLKNRRMYSNLRHQLNRLHTRTTRKAEASTHALTFSAPKIKVDIYDGKTSIDQWWFKFITFLSLQKLSEAVAIYTAILTNRCSWELFFLPCCLYQIFLRIYTTGHLQLIQAIHTPQRTTYGCQTERCWMCGWLRTSSDLPNNRKDCGPGMDITVIMNGLKPDLNAEVIKADPQTVEDLRNVVAKRRRTTTPAV